MILFSVRRRIKNTRGSEVQGKDAEQERKWCERARAELSTLRHMAVSFLITLQLAGRLPALCVRTPAYAPTCPRPRPHTEYCKRLLSPHLTCACPPRLARLKKSAGLRQIRRLRVCLLTCVMECVFVYANVDCLPWITDILSAGCAFLNTKITPSDPLGHRQDEK